MSGDRRALWLLAAGALAGIALAAVGLARSGRTDATLPPGAVAAVNGHPIPGEAFTRFVSAVAAERRELRLDPAERRHLLERMIDEELLLQRGLELGLARHEAIARRTIVSAVIAALTAEAEAVEPDEAALRAFHAEQPERFRLPPRLHVDAAFVSLARHGEEEARARAASLAAALRAGEPLGVAVERWGDPQPAPLPGGPVPQETLRQYLGPTAAAAAMAMEPGAVSDPLRTASGFRVLVLRDRQAGSLPPFEDVRAQVRAEYLRSLGEAALRNTLERLRDEAEIVRDEAALGEGG